MSWASEAWPGQDRWMTDRELTTLLSFDKKDPNNQFITVQE